MDQNNDIDYTLVGDNALVKKTNEIFKIKNIFQSYTVKVSIPTDNLSEKQLETLMELYKSDVEEDQLSNNDLELNNEMGNNLRTSEKCKVMYLLSDGKTYNTEDLIVGSINIREISISKIL